MHNINKKGGRAEGWMDGWMDVGIEGRFGDGRREGEM